jgi:hypothetical protein
MVNDGTVDCAMADWARPQSIANLAPVCRVPAGCFVFAWRSEGEYTGWLPMVPTSRHRAKRGAYRGDTRDIPAGQVFDRREFVYGNELTKPDNLVVANKIPGVI